MLQEIDKTLWTDPIKRIVKLSSDFKWHFYGRRFTNFCVSCYPDRRDYYRNKKTRNLCEGYRVHTYLDSIDDAGMSAWIYCETPEKAREMLKFAKTFLCKMPKGGINEQFFREYFKDFDTVELW